MRRALGVAEAVGLREGVGVDDAVRLRVSTWVALPVGLGVCQGVKDKESEGERGRVGLWVWVKVLPGEPEAVPVRVPVAVGTALGVWLEDAVGEALDEGLRRRETVPVQVCDGGLAVRVTVSAQVRDRVTLRERAAVTESDRDAADPVWVAVAVLLPVELAVALLESDCVVDQDADAVCVHVGFAVAEGLAVGEAVGTAV